MNQDGHGTHGDRDEDARLDALLRDAAYEGRPRDEFRRGLQRELRHNFSVHRRQNVRTAVVAAAAVVAAFALFKISDVGSDNFALVDTGTTVGDGVTVFEQAFRGGRVGGAAGSGDSATALDRDFLERIEEAKAAGDGELVGVFGWTLAGSTLLQAEYRLVIDGESVVTGRTLRELDAAAGPAMVRFIKTAKDAFEDDMAQGRIPVSGTEVVTIDGRRVLITGWTREVEGIGPVTCWRGETLDLP